MTPHSTRVLASLKSLPSETIDYIFAFVLDGEAEETSILLTLMQICRAWRTVAEARLYSSISVDQESPISRPQLGFIPASVLEKNTALLCRTLTEALWLSSHITKLTIRFPLSLTTQTYSSLITLCPDLREFSVSGHLRDDARLMREMLPKWELRLLHVNFIQADRGHLLGDSKDIVCFMHRWPEIESIVLKSERSSIIAGCAENRIHPL